MCHARVKVYYLQKLNLNTFGPTKKTKWIKQPKNQPFNWIKVKAIFYE